MSEMSTWPEYFTRAHKAGNQKAVVRLSPFLLVMVHSEAPGSTKSSKFPRWRNVGTS